MDFLTSLLRHLLPYFLSLPVMLVALSVHESAHGFAAYKLGDPTARNLGRITLNPVKHFDLLGFLSMLIFHIGWAKPVPINTRYFKKPRRDMAITGAAGPLSNVALAILHLLILRVVMIFVTNTMLKDGFSSQAVLILVALLVYLLYVGVAMNIILAIFNLIPIPPFDGSRIFYAFLPPKWYFGIMKYERYIMFGCILIFFLLNRLHMNPLGYIERWVLNGLFNITGMGRGTMELGAFNTLLQYFSTHFFA